MRHAAAREEAQTEGYEINRLYDCIDKASFDSVQAQRLAWQREHDLAAAKAALPVSDATTTLEQARRNFRSRVSVIADTQTPLPMPPATLFVRSDYTNALSRSMPAFVTPDPHDGNKHPAIVWLTGGDSNTLGDFWTVGSDSNDQSAHAFRDAGVVMMFPTLRGGNTNTDGKEYFFGEVDDVLAAADHLTELAYVDPQQIYLGGHSTGGTLALLTAETSGRFAAVFAFGPVTRVNRYPRSLVTVDFERLPADELILRSPIHWLHSLASPTYVMEGSKSPSNIGYLNELCAKANNPLLHCIPIEGSDHFSVLATVTPVIAARLVMAAQGLAFSLRADEFHSKDITAKQ